MASCKCVIGIAVIGLVCLVLWGIFVGGVYYGGVVVSQSTCICTVIACTFREWSEWSHCSQKCGPDGTQFRVRNVLQVTGCGPVMCAEPTSEERSCNRICYNGGSLTKNGCNCQKISYSGPCCECKDIDCKLSHWTKWSSCENATSRVRSRDILRGSECEGAECKGPYTEEQACSDALKGNILVAKWIIITLSIYAGILTLTIITVCILKRRTWKVTRHWFINHSTNNPDLCDGTNENTSMVRSRNTSRNRIDSLRSNSTIMG